MKPLLLNHIYRGNVLEELRKLPDNSIDCIVTSPPYWGLRVYGHWFMQCVWGNIKHFTKSKKHPERWMVRIKWRAAENGGIFSKNRKTWIGALGLEPTPEMFLKHMVLIFREGRRVLKPTGTLWLNIGDSYAAGGKNRTKEQATAKSTLAGTTISQEQSLKQISKLGGKLKPGDLVGIPWRLAFALQEDGWYLRQDIIWHKRNPMPESVTSRCTKAHEYIFLLSKRKSGEYYYDAEAIKEPASENTNARISRAELENGPAYSGRKSQKIAPAGNGLIKSNESFEAATKLMVENRNKRSVWSITSTSFSEAHFATFPQELIEPCIAAGTSEKGNCSECGAPWERIVEKSGGSIGKGSWFDHDTELTIGKMGGGTLPAKSEMKNSYKVETLGWQPSCKCGCEDVTPPVVFDPFMGAGTTALVARKKLRHFAGIELNPEYIAIAQRRLKKELGMFL